MVYYTLLKNGCLIYNIFSNSETITERVLKPGLIIIIILFYGGQHFFIKTSATHDLLKCPGTIWLKCRLWTKIYISKELSKKTYFLFPIFLEQDDVNIWYLKLLLFDVTQFIVWNKRFITSGCNEKGIIKLVFLMIAQLICSS